MIFVLGSRGFVGSAILTHLTGLGEQVAGIDIDNYEAFRGKRCTWFINANGNSDKRLAENDPAKDFDQNVASVMRTLADFPCETYLHLSTIDVYANTADPDCNIEGVAIDPKVISRYAFHKWLGENLVRRYAGRWVVFRLAGMFGKSCRKGPAYDILNGKPIWVDPHSRFLFLNTRTVADVVWKLRHKSGEVFNCAAADNLSLLEFAAIVGKPITGINGKAVLTYRVNIDKIARFASLPTSADSVSSALALGELA